MTKQVSNQVDWSQLPIESLEDIFHLIPAEHTASFHLVCKSWCQAARGSCMHMSPRRPHLQHIATHFHNLKSLKLCSDYQEPVDITSLTLLTQLTRLTQLHINVDRLCDAQATHAALSLTILQHLPQLSDLQIESGILQSISPITHLRSITRLCFSQCSLSHPDPLPTQLAPIQQLTSLRDLTLGIHTLNPDPTAPTDLTQASPQIAELTPDIMNTLANLTNLKSLQLSAWQLAPNNSLQVIGKFAHLTQLTSLRVDEAMVRCVYGHSEEDISNAWTVQAINPLTSLVYLHTLNFPYMHRLPSLLDFTCRKFRQLRCLKFWLPRNAPAMSLEAIAQLPQLRELDVLSTSAPHCIRTSGWHALDTALTRLVKLAVTWRLDTVTAYQYFTAWREWWLGASTLALRVEQVSFVVAFERVDEVYTTDDTPVDWQLLPDFTSATHVTASSVYSWNPHPNAETRIILPKLCTNLQSVSLTNQHLIPGQVELPDVTLQCLSSRLTSLTHITLNFQLPFTLDNSIDLPALQSLTLLYLTAPLHVDLCETPFKFTLSRPRTQLGPSRNPPRAHLRTSSTPDLVRDSDDAASDGAPRPMSARGKRDHEPTGSKRLPRVSTDFSGAACIEMSAASPSVGPTYYLWPWYDVSRSRLSFERLESLDLRECLIDSAVLVHIGKLKTLKKLVLEPREGQITDQGLQALYPLSNLEHFSFEIGRYADASSERVGGGMVSKLCRLSSLEFVVTWCCNFPRLHTITLGSWMNQLVRRREFVTWTQVFRENEEVVDRIVVMLQIRRSSQSGWIKKKGAKLVGKLGRGGVIKKSVLLELGW